jgi:hypothetical protein
MPRKTYNNFSLENERLKIFDQYRDPQKLNKCKYQLVTYGGIIRYSIVTEIRNREEILKRLIKMGKEIADTYGLYDDYKIYLTEDGVKELLICSQLHKDFIKFLIA